MLASQSWTTKIRFSNIQQVVPLVSRSSGLASQVTQHVIPFLATGFIMGYLSTGLPPPARIQL